MNRLILFVSALISIPLISWAIQIGNDPRTAVPLVRTQVQLVELPMKDSVLDKPIIFTVYIPDYSDEEVLHSMALVETGNNPMVVGRMGERSRYHFLRETWTRYSRFPFRALTSHSANADREALRVGKAHIADIRRKLKARGLPATPYWIASSWNAGPNWRHLTPHTRDHAQRVENLVLASSTSPSFR